MSDQRILDFIKKQMDYGRGQPEVIVTTYLDDDHYVIVHDMVVYPNGSNSLSVNVHHSSGCNILSAIVDLDPRYNSTDNTSKYITITIDSRDDDKLLLLLLSI